ncbi:MAG: HIRAN domain-containing protein [Dysgonomonas sp.]|nr:HIRAN domain-containing protein [Dysgonomonas sp.]
MGLFDFDSNGNESETESTAPTRKIKSTTYNKSGDHISFTLAGTNFCSDEELNRISTLEYAEELILEAEPTNPYDPNAIKVKTKDDFKIGYVPREITFELKNTNGAIKQNRCVYTRKSDNEKPFISIYIEFLE